MTLFYFRNSPSQQMSLPEMFACSVFLSVCDPASNPLYSLLSFADAAVAAAAAAFFSLLLFSLVLNLVSFANM